MKTTTLDSTSLKTILKRTILFGSATAIAYFFGKKLLKYRHAIPSKKDNRDYVIAPSKATTYPFSFSLPVPPIEDQGAVSSCVAHSCSYLCESVLNPKGKQNERHFATGFVYGYRPEGYYQGEGMYPREALKTLKDVGNVPKDIFPFNVEVPEAINLVQANLLRLQIVAKNNKITNFFRVTTADEIKNCLTNYGPVTAMFPVYPSLESPIDDKVEYKGDAGFRGYHQMTIYGWTGNYWNVVNSWGGSWSGDGVVLISFNYPIVETWGVSKTADAVVVPPVKKPWTTIFCPWRW
jgi:hypothetical protein